MDGSPNETILETIERRLVPDEQAKKARGEVFTPLTLVRELLYGLRKSDLEAGTRTIWGADSAGTPIEDDSNDRVGGLPLELWRDPDTKWLDPANGIGNFPFVAFAMLDYQLKTHGTKGSKEWTDTDRKTHIVEKMLFMLEIDHGNVNTSHKVMDYLSPGSKPNICCADTLNVKDDDLMRHFGVNRFHVVMGNPPFNPGLKWMKFLDWCLPKCTILTFVLPSTFTTNVTGKKVIETLKQNGLYHLRFVHASEFPGIRLDMLYLTTDKTKKEETILINNQIQIGYSDSIIDYKTQDEELSIFRKVKAMPKLKLYRGKNKTLGSKTPVETDNVKFNPDDEHPTKLLSRLGGGDLQVYWIKKVIPNEVDAPKIVFPRGTGSYNSFNTLVNLTKDIVFTTSVGKDVVLSDGIMYVPLASEDEYAAYKHYLMRSKFVRLVFLRMNHLAELTPTLFEYIPAIPVEKMGSDNDIYDALGLTESERAYINGVFEAAPKKVPKKATRGSGRRTSRNPSREPRNRTTRTEHSQ
jgi:hypothetical protein